MIQTFTNRFAWMRYVDVFMGGNRKTNQDLVIAEWKGDTGYVVESRSISRLLNTPVQLV